MPSASDTSLLRDLPQIDEVIHHPFVICFAEMLPQEQLTQAAREAVDGARQAILAGTCTAIDLDAIAQEAGMRALALRKPSLRRVVNASGVVIHTNLGRSVLAPEAREAVDQVMAGYSTLEYNTELRARGSRHNHCERLICALTGAEAAIAVNNNAAAVMMVLTEFAAGRQAVVSRGELVEIGGSFRIPDIMKLSHAQMVEVGTTNKTHAIDYERALTPETGMLLKVHPSNYRMIGFTESVGIDELRGIADGAMADERCHDLLVYEDQGSGAFVKLDCFGAYAEPTVKTSLAAGADLVSFSGDKLLGGPQAGIIVGRKELIDRLKAHPLARALRLDKMTLAALEATLRIYLDPDRVLDDIPTLRMLSEDVDVVRARAEKLRKAVSKALPRGNVSMSVVEEVARAGGGALPMCDIPTACVKVEFERGGAQDCEAFLVSRNEVPIVARISHDAVLLDARTLVDDDEIGLIADGFSAYFAELDREGGDAL